MGIEDVVDTRVEVTSPMLTGGVSGTEETKGSLLPGKFHMDYDRAGLLELLASVLGQTIPEESVPGASAPRHGYQVISGEPEKKNLSHGLQYLPGC